MRSAQISEAPSLGILLFPVELDHAERPVFDLICLHFGKNVVADRMLTRSNASRRLHSRSCKRQAFHAVRSRQRKIHYPLTLVKSLTCTQLEPCGFACTVQEVVLLI